MAIIIPSKNIYEKQNPKVRDNVIERIEVGAVEVVPNNEYGAVVYDITLKELFPFSIKPDNKKENVLGSINEITATQVEYTIVYASVRECECLRFCVQRRFPRRTPQIANSLL